jgi:hypothetical protein
MILFEAVRGQNVAAADLLLLWAWIDHRDLWYGLLEGVGKRRILASSSCPSLGGICRSEVTFNRAISLLINYGLVEANTRRRSLFLRDSIKMSNNNIEML